MKLCVMTWGKGRPDDLYEEFVSPLEFLYALTGWEGYDWWRGYVYVKTGEYQNRFVMACQSRWTAAETDGNPVLFDPTCKGDLEYVEMKVVEMWEYALPLGEKP